ncbi:MAG: serine hydrolase [Capsulimonadales bacterium]|nr:serine hydrolase [Capsulimonadales bacterium]
MPTHSGLRLSTGRLCCRAVSLWPLILMILLSGCGSHRSSRRTFDTGRATRLVSEYATATRRSGVSSAVVRNGSLLWSGSTGIANKTLNTRVTDDTVFAIASISKTVTAVAVMQLVEEGKLDLDADINRYLPFTLRNPKAAGNITLRHLLTHTSGISDTRYYALAEASPESPAFHYYRDSDPTLSLADFCRAFFSEDGTYFGPESFNGSAAGTTFEYSNIGMALAGYIVERAAGESFADFTRRRIFQPLGMTRTGWRVAEFATRELAMPYGPEGEALGNYTFADYPNGGLRTTARDLSRFLRAFIQDGVLEGRRILQAATVREMKRVQYPNIPEAEQQRLGWNGVMVGSQLAIGHSGAERGISTGMYYSTATGSGAIVLTNGSLTSVEDLNAQSALLESLIREADR